MASTTSESTVVTGLTKLATEPLLSIRNIAKHFGKNIVLRDISLDIAEGEFLTILGESGSGKTTLVRIIAGFETANSGQLWMSGERLDHLPPYRRRVHTVFQHYTIFPHLSVFENVAYGLRARKVARPEIARRVEEALSLVKMGGFAERSPRQLSGGQQQRVALARALVNRPQLLLLDEPLAALDASLRREMRTELKSLQREVGISFLFVTHDQEEAMALSDRVALLRSGRLEQVATPREIYFRPSSAYTAEFVGQTNLLRGEVAQGVVRCGSLVWRAGGADGPTTFSLRPESIRLVNDNVAAHSPRSSSADEASDLARPSHGGAPSQTVRFRARVENQSFGGASDLLEVKCEEGRLLLVRLPSRGNLDGERDFEFTAVDAIRVRD